MQTNSSNGDANNQIQDSDGQSLDDLLVKAGEAVAQGENVEQVLEVMLTSLPANAREKARKMFAALLAKRGLRQPMGDADIPSRAALSRIRSALAISTRQMMERISKLLARRPDLVAVIQQAGHTLVRNGVKNDQVALSDADLGTMAPGVTAAKPQRDQGTSRS